MKEKLRLETMFELEGLPDPETYGERKALILELKHRSYIGGRDLQCMANLLENLFQKIENQARHIARLES